MAEREAIWQPGHQVSTDHNRHPGNKKSWKGGKQTGRERTMQGGKKQAGIYMGKQMSMQSGRKTGTRVGLGETGRG